MRHSFLTGGIHDPFACRDSDTDIAKESRIQAVTSVIPTYWFDNCFCSDIIPTIMTLRDDIRGIGPGAAARCQIAVGELVLSTPLKRSRTSAEERENCADTRGASSPTPTSAARAMPPRLDGREQSDACKDCDNGDRIPRGQCESCGRNIGVAAQDGQRRADHNVGQDSGPHGNRDRGSERTRQGRDPSRSSHGDTPSSRGTAPPVTTRPPAASRCSGVPDDPSDQEWSSCSKLDSPSFSGDDIYF